MRCSKAKSRVLNRTCVPAFLNMWFPRLPEFSPTDTQNLYSSHNKNIYAVWHSSARIWRGKGKSRIASSWEPTWTSQLAENCTSSSAPPTRFQDRQKRNQKSINDLRDRKGKGLEEKKVLESTWLLAAEEKWLPLCKGSYFCKERCYLAA